MWIDIFLGCISFGGFGTMSGLCEIWTITSIAYERCRAISTPLTKAKRLGHKKVRNTFFKNATENDFRATSFHDRSKYVLTI